MRQSSVFGLMAAMLVSACSSDPAPNDAAVTDVSAATDRPVATDAPAPTEDLEAFMMREGRFSVIAREDPSRHEALLALARTEVTRRRALYEQLAAMRFPITGG